MMVFINGRQADSLTFSLGKVINVTIYRQQEREEEEKSPCTESRNLCSHTCNQVPQFPSLHAHGCGKQLELQRFGVSYLIKPP